jgi:hypothetical protein
MGIEEIAARGSNPVTGYGFAGSMVRGAAAKPSKLASSKFELGTGPVFCVSRLGGEFGNSGTGIDLPFEFDCNRGAA